MNADDQRWLDAAVRQAAPFLGTTAENPTVGAIVVDAVSQRLLGRAVTARGGRPHAESQAIEDAGPAAKGATLYVTLEPCNHWGRTPPCVDAILRAGIARVVVGISDPDPRTDGQGMQRLRDAGVEVVLADHAPSARLHEGFVMRLTRGRPFVTAKLAVSADGKVGLPNQANVPITGEAARRWTHMQRALADAVIIGAGTARVDDPQLTVRLTGLEARTPLRVVVAGGRTLNTRMNLIASLSGYPVAIIATPENPVKAPPSVEVIRVSGVRGRPDPKLALAALGAKGLSNVLVEAGPTFLAALLDAGLVDRFHLLVGEGEVGPLGLPATPKGSIEGRIGAAGFSLVDHRVLGADNLRTFERTF